MRLWTLHPKYLDPQGLVALWREALLARAVLQGNTKGYRNHPQLERFQEHSHPVNAINGYLLGVFTEATSRGYRFDRSKVVHFADCAPITASSGQIDYELGHLLHKLELRSPTYYAQWRNILSPETHPLFSVVSGPVASWERTSAQR